jgi:hypothetical protein
MCERIRGAGGCRLRDRALKKTWRGETAPEIVDVWNPSKTKSPASSSSTLSLFHFHPRGSVKP